MDLTGKRVVASENVLVRELHGESVLLDLGTESYFGLDEVGTAMWHALVDCGGVDLAHESLMEQFEVDAERLRADLGQFVSELAEAGLVDVGDA